PIIEWMAPIPAFERAPKLVTRKGTQVSNNGDRCLDHAFIAKRTRQVMMIRDEMTSVGANDDGNGMGIEITFGGFAILIAPAIAFECDFAHPHRYLRWQ